MVLLGRRDQPTDGVEDYCEWLAEALRAKGRSIRFMRVAWDRHGWPHALLQLRQELSSGGEDSWVLLQYTHLTWSRWGFPVRALTVARAVRSSGARLGVVIHDPWGFPGARVRDRARRCVQQWVMRRLFRIADCVFTTISSDALSWLDGEDRRSPRLLPVGSNIPPLLAEADGMDAGDGFTVTVFGITGGRREEEVQEIGGVVRRVANELDGVHLVVLGRGSSEVEPLLRRVLDDTPVRLTVCGVTSPEEVSRWLSRSDAFLFVRGGLSSRRTTAVAAIAHGVPIIGYRSIETAWPITEAGVVLIEPGDVVGFSEELLRLVRDRAWAAELRERNRQAYTQHFAWDRIAETVQSVMQDMDARR